MKPIPAIIEPAAIDVDMLEQRIIVALADQANAEKVAARHEQQALDARSVAKARRLEIGTMLLKLRAAWPERGPKAKGWGDLLVRIKMAESTARMYLDEARDPKGFAEKRAASAKTEDDGDDDDDGQYGPRIDPTGDGSPPPFRQLSEDELVQALGRLDPGARKRVLRTSTTGVEGGTGETARGTWCTSKQWALAVGPWQLDPFSNPRSKIASVERCMLEDGGDAFGGGKPGEVPGCYATGNSHGQQPRSGIAGKDTTVWIQPPYELVMEAIAHYGHTRFCALLRWSPDTKWFARLWPLVQVVCHPIGERMDFDPPPGVEKSGDMPFPHALYYADERDVTKEVRERCIVWRIDHSLDSKQATPDLHIVR